MVFLWLMMGSVSWHRFCIWDRRSGHSTLHRIGASRLHEIASGALFFAVGGVWWWLARLGKLLRLLSRPGCCLSMLLGRMFVLAMTRVYQIETVPTWYSGENDNILFLTMALSGPLFAALLLRAANVEFNGRFFASLSVLALFAQLRWY
jgi:Tat-targeted selenate reductase subunit YnfH